MLKHNHLTWKLWKVTTITGFWGVGVEGMVKAIWRGDKHTLWMTNAWQLILSKGHPLRGMNWRPVGYTLLRLPPIYRSRFVLCRCCYPTCATWVVRVHVDILWKPHQSCKEDKQLIQLYWGAFWFTVFWSQCKQWWENHSWIKTITWVIETQVSSEDKQLSELDWGALWFTVFWSQSNASDGEKTTVYENQHLGDWDLSFKWG